MEKTSYSIVTIKTSKNGSAELINRNFSIELSNVTDRDYFLHGLQYLNLQNCMRIIEENLETHEDAKSALLEKYDSSEEAESDVEYMVEKDLVEEWTELKHHVEKMQIDANITDEEKDVFNKDNFLHLCAHACGFYEATLPEWYVAWNAIVNYVDERDAKEKDAEKIRLAFKAVKKSLEKCAAEFSTTNDTHYKAAVIHINSTMTHDIISRAYTGTKLSKKTGKYTRGQFMSKSAHKETLAQMIGRLQGSISNTAD